MRLYKAVPLWCSLTSKPSSYVDLCSSGPLSAAAWSRLIPGLGSVLGQGIFINTASFKDIHLASHRPSLGIAYTSNSTRPGITFGAPRLKLVDLVPPSFTRCNHSPCFKARTEMKEALRKLSPMHVVCT